LRSRCARTSPQCCNSPYTVSERAETHMRFGKRSCYILTFLLAHDCNAAWRGMLYHRFFVATHFRCGWRPADGTSRARESTRCHAMEPPTSSAIGTRRKLYLTFESIGWKSQGYRTLRMRVSGLLRCGWPTHVAASLCKSSAQLQRELLEERVFTLCIEWRHT
jgi:hypothetical protein